MPKKREAPKPIVKDDPSRIIQTSMEDVMHNSMIPYAEHVILERALPRVEDGLKPVQRRILYTMLELGNTPDKPHRKCARIVGDCLGKYHPHGDSSVYDALVRMAQDFSMRTPMVDGHGNFGSVDGDSAAAMRYTEARMAPLAMQMLRDIDKDTVPFRLNFDDSLQEPDLLPARFPNLLINGASGIAVGLATNIPPHNPGETIRAVIAQMQNPDISLDELMRILPGPDFPTGGVLLKNDEIRQGYETGRSKLTLRARISVEDGSAGRKLLVISEIPYQVNKAAMLEKIYKLTEEKKAMFSGVYDVRDESDRTGMRAVIELKKDADVDRTLAALYKYSDLQVTFGVNMVAIADGKPMQMGLRQVIDCFIRHQKQVVTRRTRYDLERAKARAHILEGLMIAVDNLDEVIALIRASKNPKEAKEKLMTRFSLTDIQAQAILDMRLQRLTNLEIVALRKEYADLLKLIDRLEGILASEKKLLAVIQEELEEVAKAFEDPRRTAIESADPSTMELPPVEAVAEEAVVVYTCGGQLKRMDPAQLRRTPMPTAEEDADATPLFSFTTDSNASLLFLTNAGNAYLQPVGQLAVTKPRDRGQMLTGVLAGWEEGEAPLLILCYQESEWEQAPDLVFVTEQGQIKRSSASLYHIRSRKFAAVGLKNGDQLLNVFTADDADLLLVSQNGYTIRFPADSVPVQGRTATGVKAMNLDKTDRLLWADRLPEGSELVLFTERGYGKRLPAAAFEPQNRGGKGVYGIYFKKNGSNGRQVVAAVRVSAAPATLEIRQLRTAPTRIAKDEILLESRSGYGMPYVMALLDDVVTGVRVIEG